ERLFMAGNQVGKSESSAFEMAVHLTGQYPQWGKGRRFDHPIRAVAAGGGGVVFAYSCGKNLRAPPPPWGILARECAPAARSLVRVPGMVSATSSTRYASNMFRAGHRHSRSKLTRPVARNSRV